MGYGGDAGGYVNLTRSEGERCSEGWGREGNVSGV